VGQNSTGVDTDLVHLDRARKGKMLANADWGSRTDPDAKIAKMKTAHASGVQAGTLR
jgi:hypothetical protein